MKVASLFVLLIIGYYKNQHVEIEKKMQPQKVAEASKNALISSEIQSTSKDYRVVRAVIKK